MKIIYFDCETSGLNPIENDILTIAFIIEIDGVVREKVYIKTQPFNYNSISKEALEVNGLKLEDIKKYQAPKEAYDKIVKIFSKYINKFNKKDKFIAIGHNIKFDIDMLSNFFLKNGDKYFGSFVDYHFIDTMVILNLLKYKGLLEIENVKLVTACEKYNIPLDAHDAKNDIKATKELFHKLISKINFKDDNVS